MTSDPTPRPAVAARQAPDTPTTDQRLGDVWLAEHRHLVGLASRMLGDTAGAEDVVQEAFGRLVQVGLDEIHDVRGWLTVVVRRLCLNRISSAYARRESVAGAAPPDRSGLVPNLLGQASGDPADRVTLDDQVQLALALVLDRLTPAERTSFVLHDVFGFPFTAIGEIVGRSSTACRQLASRARRTVRATPPAAAQGDAAGVTRGGTTKADAHRTLVERFIAACSEGDVAGLVEILDPDVVGEATLLGHGPLGGFEGAQGVATAAIGFVGKGSGAVLVPFSVEGKPGLLAVVDGRVQSIIRFDQDGGIIQHIDTFVIPAHVFRQPD